MSSNINYDFILKRIHFPGTIVLDEPGQTYTCGRGKENQILCLSLTVSRQHCIFFRNTHEVYIIDLGSSNGVYVNEVKQKPKHMVKLNDNDIIGIGCPNSNDNNSDMYIYKLHFVVKTKPVEEQKLMELSKASLFEDTLISSSDITSSSSSKRKADKESSHLSPFMKISKISSDTNIPCKIEASGKKLNSIANKINLGQEIEIINIRNESNKAKLNTSSSDTHQTINDIDTNTDLFEINNKQKITEQGNLLNEINGLKSITENEVIFLDSPEVIDTEISQQNPDNNSIEICQSNDAQEKKYYDNNIVHIKDESETSTHVDISNDIEMLLQQQDYPKNKKIFDEAHNNLLKSKVPSIKKSELNKSMDRSTNIVHNGDYFIKIEDELIINDDDEEAIKNSMRNCSSYAFSPIKLKQIKQEPKSRFSALDIVNLSDDEENVFPCSQLFDSGLNVSSEIKEKVKQECNDNHNEDVNRLDDTEVVISLSDSEDEDNVWFQRLSQSQLFNDTISNNDETKPTVKAVMDEPMNIDTIDNDLRNIIEESNENVNDVSCKFNVDAKTKDKEDSKVQEENKDKKEKIKKKHKNTANVVKSSKVNVATKHSDISSDTEKMEIDESTKSSPVNTGQKNKNESFPSLNEKQNKIDNNTVSENTLNCTTYSKEIKSMIKKTLPIIDPPHMPTNKTFKSTHQSKERSNKTHVKTTSEKKKTSAEKKIEEYMYLKEQKKRRSIHTWAKCLPPSKNKKLPLTKEEKKELLETRKNKLKKIATEDKRVTTTDNETLKRSVTKPKAKVSLKSRGDFLINETQPKININRAVVTESKEKKKLKDNSINVTRSENDNVVPSVSDLQNKTKTCLYKETLNNVTKHLKQSLTITDINAIRINKVNKVDTNLNKPEDVGNVIDEAFHPIENENTGVTTNEIKAKKNEKTQKENRSPNRQTTSVNVIKRKSVSFNDIPEVREYEIDSQNTLRKLKGKDAPIPVDKLPSKKSMETNCPKIEDFLLRIFWWNPVWLEEQKNLQQMPPIVKESELVPMLTFYRSYSDYYKIAVPLLLLEIWYGITKDFETIEKNVNRPTMMCSTLQHSITHTHVPSVNMYLSTLTVQVLITKENLSKQIHPVYGDLVFFEYVKNENGRHIFHKIFAYVTNMHQTIITSFTEYNKDLENYVQKPYALLTYTLMTRLLEQNLIINRVQRIRTATYLRSSMRMIQAIQYLPQSPLMDLILQPKVEAYQLPQLEVPNYQLITKDKLNQKQLQAVTRVTEAVVQEKAKVCFIQGPPGTGKSKVIVNIVTEILYGNNRYENNKAALRILVCAPSNAAIDEIVLRLLAIRATIKQKRFKMVRIGKPETMHQTVKDISLTELGKRDAKRVTESYLAKNIPIDSVEEEKRFLEARINALKCEVLNSQKTDDTYKKHLQMKIADMITKYELLQNHRPVNEMSSSEFTKLQRVAERRILEGADIITCTLSSCYTNQMESIFGGSKKRISVCIVDEASQSCEAETLIPLLLGVNTLVLVGDPNQLPATVISQQAKKLGLDQSLFSRIQNAFQGERNNPIIMLNTQYRMAYSISYWPNKYFYGNQLKNAAKNVTTFPFHSYRVLNINASQNNDKFSNTNEAEFIGNIILCMMIQSNLEKWESNISVGVLTPYRNQRSLVSEKINKKILTIPENIKKKFTVEVNTVDSFQGQERDIIIMSCVRSHGIGFLSDRQRLCVALTRAKHTLILCGNFYTFMRDQMWKALILDAKSRGIFLNIDANANLQEIKTHIIK
ncbi:hypothetical protein KPH14_001927 [Odynerus spinipes]|uniref:FHA domain-containing protein n=1 Tax=Odynerus spinipes TaxID=1348599 RepID=A0AAD9S290_9HYME|nr:hypothetical protein KPH14_001927 [Odynerus spinipes]